MENSKGLESGARESLEDRLDAAIRAEYIQFRETFISLIHSYFAEIYQLSIGVKNQDLPLPSLVKGGFVPDEKTAYGNLRKAESFLNTMKLNVDESLAIRAFCYSMVFK